MLKNINNHYISCAMYKITTLLLTYFMCLNLAYGQNLNLDGMLRIGTDADFPPWTFMDEDTNSVIGYETDLANAICKQAEYKCEIIVTPWQDIMLNLLAGEYDIILSGMSITDERRKKVDFTQEYFPPAASHFATLRNSKINISNLRNQKIGVLKDTIQDNYITKKYGNASSIIYYQANDAMLNDLLTQKINIIFASKTFLTAAIDSANGSIIKRGKNIFLGNGVGGAIRKVDQETLRRVNQAISALKADGTIDNLIRKWFKLGPFYNE